MARTTSFTARATLLVALTLLGGCVSSQGGGSDLASTSSPSRYEADPDKPKRVCESTMIGNEPKNICY